LGGKTIEYVDYLSDDRVISQYFNVVLIIAVDKVGRTGDILRRQ